MRLVVFGSVHVRDALWGDPLLRREPCRDLREDHEPQGEQDSRTSGESYARCLMGQRKSVLGVAWLGIDIELKDTNGPCTDFLLPTHSPPDCLVDVCV